MERGDEPGLTLLRTRLHWIDERAEGGDGEALAGRVLCSGRGAPTPHALREAFRSAVPSFFCP